MLKTLATVPLLLLASRVAAEGCNTISYTTCADRIVHWYDPETGEICDPLDCGGGRAPPKTDVPGCPMYTGSETRATGPSYLPCWTPSATATATATDADPSTTFESSSSSSGTVHIVTETSFSTVTGSSTVVVVTSTATIPTPDNSATSFPSTTPAPILSMSSDVTGSSSSGAGASSSGSASAQTTTTFNAGGALTGSLGAVAGAALGAIALI
ncbi:Glycoside hydrolase 18 protein [Penicillium argentinense]|uniref:Glycoside hydrolase 18 protein n=1 Tax=Penicillium argentinense TaxID=1131581 RepID=A0A9W9JUT5_9EURO|nr:Glycoside hydrolase 18 protein [Penicillium argentinense]KAJ5082216.1 Glycoside hydrolase 18 protein [Penicillium argentinense]